MKALVHSQIEAALHALQRAGEFPDDAFAGEALADIPVERSRDAQHGDFASPVALGLARALKRKPRDIAELITSHLPASDAVERVEIAGPGFINFFLRKSALHAVVAQVIERGEAYGRGEIGRGQPVQVEFVSANPTGPLHVGHGRGAAYGAVVANLLEASGFDVQREYYVNDAGRQMDILAASVWLRYQEHHGETVPFPSKGYRGVYVRDMAIALSARDGDAYLLDGADFAQGLPADPDDPDKQADTQREMHMDALIERAKARLGQGYQRIFDFACDTQVNDIREDLREFRVEYDRWFSEKSLVESGDVQTVIQQLIDNGHIYDRCGTKWFRTTDFGDEKDRVVVRNNGASTYFASDIAYVYDKFRRGFEHIIYIWGADHHGYVARLKAAVQALGHDPERTEILLVQFAQLFRGGEKMQMSTRSGEFVTLRELREEVGTDAARFFYVMRRCEQHLDFDLDLAKAQRNENPVHYVHYAHARISSTLRRGDERGLALDLEHGLAQLELLNLEHEQTLMRTLARYSEVVEEAALAREPHQIAFYLRELANDLHGYYNLDGMRLLDPDPSLRNARLALCMAVRQVLRNGLALLGVGAPDEM